MPSHFSPAALKFLTGLTRHNDRDWFNQRKPIYETELKAPLLALIAEINAHLPPSFVRDPGKCMMRIYRDIRFSKDKHPYKTHVAAWWARHGMEKTSGGGFYFQFGPTGITIAAGVYMPEREQLLAIRRHLLDHHERFRKLLASKRLKTAGLEVFDPLKMTRAPKGFPPDHPALDLILQRQWGISAQLPADLGLSPTLARQIVTRFQLAEPLVAFLNEPFTPATRKPIF